jgi:hypothetical protein
MIVKLPNGLQRLDALWDHCDTRISGECRGFLAGSKAAASISTTAVADGNEIIETMASGEVKRPLATARRNIAVTYGSEPAANVTDMGLIEDATGPWHPAEVSRGHSRFPCA